MMAEDRDQRAEGRSQITEIRGQKEEVRLGLSSVSPQGDLTVCALNIRGKDAI